MKKVTRTEIISVIKSNPCDIKINVINKTSV